MAAPADCNHPETIELSSRGRQPMQKIFYQIDFFIEYIVYSATHNLTGSSVPILIVIFILITNIIVFSKSAQK